MRYTKPHVVASVKASAAIQNTAGTKQGHVMDNDNPLISRSTGTAYPADE